MPVIEVKVDGNSSYEYYMNYIGKTEHTNYKLCLKIASLAYQSNIDFIECKVK